MRNVAARLHCDPSTVSLAADRLQATGLVARQPDPADGRKRTLALTQRGHDLWEALSTRLHSSGLFADLDAEEQRAPCSRCSPKCDRRIAHSRSQPARWIAGSARCLACARYRAGPCPVGW